MIDTNLKYGGKKAFLKHIFFNVLGKLRFYQRYGLPTQLNNSRLVFVCSGNICRSAMAHHQLAQLSDRPVTSIGLDTVDGKPANERFSKYSKDQGVDLSFHKATSINSFEAKDEDVFICMETWQCEQIRRYFPMNQTTLLGLWLSKQRYYLHDPYASSPEYAKHCASLISEAVHSIDY